MVYVGLQLFFHPLPQTLYSFCLSDPSQAQSIKPKLMGLGVDYRLYKIKVGMSLKSFGSPI